MYFLRWLEPLSGLLLSRLNIGFLGNLLQQPPSRSFQIERTKLMENTQLRAIFLYYLVWSLRKCTVFAHPLFTHRIRPSGNKKKRARNKKRIEERKRKTIKIGEEYACEVYQNSMESPDWTTINMLSWWEDWWSRSIACFTMFHYSRNLGTKINQRKPEVVAG